MHFIAVSAGRDFGQIIASRRRIQDSSTSVVISFE